MIRILPDFQWLIFHRESAGCSYPCLSIRWFWQLECWVFKKWKGFTGFVGSIFFFVEHSWCWSTDWCYFFVVFNTHHQLHGVSCFARPFSKCITTWVSMINLGGGFKYVFYFHPDPRGNDPVWRAYFSNGLFSTMMNPHQAVEEVLMLMHVCSCCSNCVLATAYGVSLLLRCFAELHSVM